MTSSPTPSDDVTLHLRPVTDADVPAVLALNEADVAVLSPLDRPRLGALRAWAQRFDVVEASLPDGSTVVAGFVVVVPPGTAYDSVKYRWFAEHLDDFLYLDRIVVGAGFRRRGVGRLVYSGVEADASIHGRVCLEIDVEPPNLASLAFHAGRGYVEVARLGEPGSQVSMQVKELPTWHAAG